MPLSEILESRLTVSVLEDVDVRLSEKKKFMVIAFFLYGNRPMTPAYSTNTYSYVIGFCLRLMGLKAYLDCLYE